MDRNQLLKCTQSFRYPATKYDCPISNWSVPKELFFIMVALFSVKVDEIYF